MLQVPQRTLTRWVELGLLVPERVPMTLGSERWLAGWTARDLREAEIVAELVRRYGLPVATVAQLMEDVRKRESLEDLEGAVYLQLAAPVADGSRIVPALRVTTHPEDHAQTELSFDKVA